MRPALSDTESSLVKALLASERSNGCEFALRRVNADSQGAWSAVDRGRVETSNLRDHAVSARSEALRIAAAARCVTAGADGFDRGGFESCAADVLGSRSARFIARRKRALCPHRLHQRYDSHDLHDAFEIVGQYMEAHLGTDTRQPLGQEMR